MRLIDVLIMRHERDGTGGTFNANELEIMGIRFREFAKKLVHDNKIITDAFLGYEEGRYTNYGIDESIKVVLFKHLEALDDIRKRREEEFNRLKK